MNTLIKDGTDTAIGVYKFADRKKPCLCVRKKGSITVYGTFTNDEVAEEFMNEVAEFFGVTQKVKGECP